MGEVEIMLFNSLSRARGLPQKYTDENISYIEDKLDGLIDLLCIRYLVHAQFLFLFSFTINYFSSDDSTADQYTSALFPVLATRRTDNQVK